MKTAQEWFYGLNSEENKLAFIRAIQLDAFKAGMTKAAEIAYQDKDDAVRRGRVADDILTARDNLTSLP